MAVDPGAVSPRPAGVGDTERWIDVNLSTQTLVAYEGDTPVFNTLVSSGLPQWPTVTGQFRTYMKDVYKRQDVDGAQRAARGDDLGRAGRDPRGDAHLRCRRPPE